MNKEPNIAILIWQLGTSSQNEGQLKQLLPWENTTLDRNAH